MRDYKHNELYPFTKVLSSSQFLLYEKDPFEFYLEYHMGSRRKEGSALKVGKILAEAYADRQYDHKAALLDLKQKKETTLSYAVIERIQGILGLIQKAPETEFEIKVTLPNDWSLRATLDGYFPKTWKVIENKSGVEANEWTKKQGMEMGWDQERVNFNDQITFGAFCHWMKFGIPPSQIQVNWWNLDPKATKFLSIFNTTRNVRALKSFGNRIEKVIEGIEAENWTRKHY